MSKWVLKPGERLPNSRRPEDVIDYYLSDSQNFNKNLLVTIQDQTIYFMEIEKDKSMKSADIAMEYNKEYYFLPKDMAKDIAEAHALHIKLLTKAHEFLEARVD